MLKELIEYIKEHEGDNELGDYLDTRYVRLTDQHYDQIASAMNEGELESKNSSKCPAERFFLHFNETILFVNKQTEEDSAYRCCESSFEFRWAGSPSFCYFG